MPRLDDYYQQILSQRQQADLKNEWLKERLDTLLPRLMARENLDMWLVIAREYNEDPVLMSLLPAPAMTARRRTILVFCRNFDGSIDRLALDRYGYGDFYQAVWNPSEEGQYECLTRIIQERNPVRIGLNYSKHFAFGDGLSYNEYFELSEELGDGLMARVCSASRLCLGWLEKRSLAELNTYPFLIEMGHALIAETFSNQLIQVGKTTTDDLVWHMRQRLHDLGLSAWFQPDCEIQAQGQTGEHEKKRKVIMAGDLLWCDVGFQHLGLCTDHQQVAYILKPNESDAPQGLKAALADANRLQDIHLEEMQVGRTGNEVLQAILKRARGEGLEPIVYSHPLGYHGHGAGTTIGLWDMQMGVVGKGDYELYDYTCYSIELAIKKAIPEWDNQILRLALEEDAALVDGTMHWLDGRQTAFHLIG